MIESGENNDIAVFLFSDKKIPKKCRVKAETLQIKRPAKPAGKSWLLHKKEESQLNELL